MHLPFGGTKDTGNGHREAGQAALDVFTEWKSIYVDYSGSCSARRSTTPEEGMPRSSSFLTPRRGLGPARALELGAVAQPRLFDRVLSEPEPAEQAHDHRERYDE